MDFSFSPEQDDLRREARAFLEANPAPTMEQLAELGWVGILAVRRLHVPRRGGALRGARPRALRGPYVEDEVGGDRDEAARRVRARSGRDRLEGDRARDRVRRPSASSSARRSAPTRRSRTRSSTRTSRSSSRARSRTGRRGRVAEDDEQADARGRGGEVAGVRGGGARVREVDPGARRHRLHVGAPAAPLLQARAVARRRARVRPRAARGDRRIPAVLVTGASTGIGAATAERAARPRLDGLRVGARRRRGARGDDASSSSTSPTRRRSRARPREIDELDALVDNAGIAIAAPLEFLPPDELTRQLDVNVVGQLRVLQAFLPALRARAAASC